LVVDHIEDDGCLEDAGEVERVVVVALGAGTIPDPGMVTSSSPLYWEAMATPTAWLNWVPTGLEIEMKRPSR